MKDELGGKIMKKEIVGLIAKTFSHLINNSSEDKKNKRHKKVCHQVVVNKKEDIKCSNITK